jgi:diadenosine tetraphosphate (Ap4A) HIT family hydrolase
MLPTSWDPGKVCVVHLKRHTGDLADLTQEETLESLALLRTHETAVRSTLGATMFNWSCHMNHAYRQRPPNPHIHWWAVPRYDRPVAIGGRIFENTQFGESDDHARWHKLPSALHQQITHRIHQAISP